MKKFLLCLCTLAFLIALVSCGYEYDGESLLGSWRVTGVGEDDYTVYNFYSDEKVTVTYYNYGIAYATADCYYEVNKGNEITIIGEDGYYDIYTFKIKKDILTIKKGSIKLKLEKYENDYNKDERIFGTWKEIYWKDVDKEEGDTYIFGEDYDGLGYGKEGGMYFAYSTKGDILHFEPLYNSKLLVHIEYKIEENKLYFITNGEIDAILERVEK